MKFLTLLITKQQKKHKIKIFLSETSRNSKIPINHAIKRFSHHGNANETTRASHRRLEKYYIVKLLLTTLIQSHETIPFHLETGKLLLRQTKTFLKKHILKILSPFSKHSLDCDNCCIRGIEEGSTEAIELESYRDHST